MKEIRTTMGVIFIALSAIAIFVYLLQPDVIDGFVGCNGQCGPDGRRPFSGLTYATCDDPYRCINGYCRDDNPPVLGVDTGLPVRPNRTTFEVPARV